MYVCFFSLQHFCIFLELLLHKSPFFVLFCCFFWGKIYQVILVQELLPKWRMEQKGLIPSLMCYWPSSCLLLECFSNMGARYVRMYVLLLLFFFSFITTFGTSIFQWISCFVLFRFVSFNIWSMVDMIMSCQRICLLTDLYGGLILSCGFLRNLQVICQRRGGIVVREFCRFVERLMEFKNSYMFKGFLLFLLQIMVCILAGDLRTSSLTKLLNVFLVHFCRWNSGCVCYWRSWDIFRGLSMPSG